MFKQVECETYSILNNFVIWKFNKIKTKEYKLIRVRSSFCCSMSRFYGGDIDTFKHNVQDILDFEFFCHLKC
jgi:hypothetical protein